MRSTAARASSPEETPPAWGNHTPMDGSQPNAAAAGTFVLGDLTVNRLGFGAMRITGPGIWGDPPGYGLK